MKVIFKDLKHGEIKLIPENLDDIWHLYNIIKKMIKLDQKNLRKNL